MTSINDATDATARRLTNRISGTIGADAVLASFVAPVGIIAWPDVVARDLTNDERHGMKNEQDLGIDVAAYRLVRQVDTVLSKIHKPADKLVSCRNAVVQSGGLRHELNLGWEDVFNAHNSDSVHFAVRNDIASAQGETT